jgi:hypothetical protein
MLNRLRAFLASFGTAFFTLLVATAPQPAFAATAGTFTQTAWDAASTPAATAADPGDQTGWTAHSANLINVINGGADLALGSTPDSLTHTTDSDFAPGSGTNILQEDGGVSMKIVSAPNTTVLNQQQSFSVGDILLSIQAAGGVIYTSGYGSTDCGPGYSDWVRRSVPGTLAVTNTYTGVNNSGSNPIYQLFHDTATGYNYLAGGTTKLRILNTSLNGISKTYSTTGDATAVYVSAGYAYVVAGGALEIVNVTTPTSPSLAYRYVPAASVVRVFTSGNYAYLATVSGGVEVLDVSTPTSPVKLTTIAGTARDVYVKGNYLYVVGAGLQIYDVSIPAAPALVGSTAAFTNGNRIKVADGYAYVLDGISGAGTFRVVDVSTDPTTPVLTGSLVSSRDLAVIGTDAYLASDGSSCVSQYAYLRRYSLGAYPTTATYTSDVVNIGGNSGYTTVDFNYTNPASNTATNPVQIQFRSGPTATVDGSWTTWQTAITTSGGAITGLGTNPYLQYQAIFTTDDTTVTPVLNDIAINFTHSVTSGWLESSPYNTGVATNVIDSLSWTENLPTDTDAQIQIRTAADNAGSPGAWSAWIGPDGTGSSYWNSVNTYPGGCSGSGTITCNIAPVLRDGVGDQWFQYKVALTTGGANNPIFSDISIGYGTGTTSFSKITITQNPVASLETNEAGTTTLTFDVALDSAPAQDVVVDLYTSDSSEGGVTPSTLTFTNAGGGAAQQVTVTGQNDDIDDGSQSYSLHAAAAISNDNNFDDVIAADSFTITNLDDDTAGVTITPSTGLVTGEDLSTDTFTVALDTEPTQDVVIDVTSDDTSEGVVLDDSALPVSPLSLTFTPANWNSAQTVTIRGVDDYIVEQPSTTYNIQFSASSPGEGSETSYDGITVTDANVTNTDDDTAGVTVCVPSGSTEVCKDASDASLLVSTNEPFGFATFRVALNAEPNGNVSFTLASSDSSEGRVSPICSTMSFDSSNWQTGSGCTLYAVDDSDADGTVDYFITTSNMIATDPVDVPVWNNFAIADIPARTLDDDSSTPTIAVAPTTGVVTTENGGSAIIGVRLSRAPTAGKTVTINLASDNTAEGVVSPASITFTDTYIPWSTKEATITGIGDRLADGNVAYNIVTTVDTTDANRDTAFDTVNPSDVSVTNTDTIGAVTPGITVSPVSGLVTTEAGAQAAFDVSLDAPPTDNVTVGLSVSLSSPSSRTVGSLSTSSLTFTQLNWATPQTVVVSGVNDIIDDGDQAYSVVTAAAVSAGDAGYNGVDPSDVSLTNMNDDQYASPTVTITNTDAPEAGSGQFIFTRNSDTTNPLTVNFSQTGGTATAGDDYTALGTNVDVVIPAGSASVNIPVDAINDSIVEGSESVTITLNDIGTYLLGTTTSTLNIIDNDVAGLTVSPSYNLLTTEAGLSDAFDVGLGSQPGDTVTVTVTSDDPTEVVLLNSTPLTFTPQNWFLPQTVTIIGQADADTVDTSFTITLDASSTDFNYNISGVTASGKNLDADSRQSVSVLATTSAVGEASTQLGKFTVSRAVATSTPLDVFFNASGGTAQPGVDFLDVGTKVTISENSTSADVAIDPINDALREGDETVVLKLANGTDYLAAKPFSDTVVITDDETSLSPLANFVVDQEVSEGAVVTVTAYLSDTAVTYPVTIPYTVSGTATSGVDHDATSGSIVINSSDTSGSFTFNALTDAVSDNGETVIFTMGTPVNARKGARNTHVVTINDVNVQPEVTVEASQGGLVTHQITTGGGDVTVTATVTDPNSGDAHSYDWSATNTTLKAAEVGGPSTSATFVFDPSGLVNGNFYAVRLTVTDDGTPAKSSSVDWLVEVAASPALTGTDSDNDGVADDVESFDDSDGDGIPDYLDPSGLASNELQMFATQPDSYIIRTEPGLTLRLGQTALAAGSDGALVTEADIAAYGGGEGQAGSADPVDTVTNTGGYFDFEISGLTKAGQSVMIVLPQLEPIPENAAYRKYDPTTGWGWRDFASDANNTIASAKGSPGNCPLPGDDVYTSGLVAGYYCVRLTIQDGGPNDLDNPGNTNGLANFVIKDPAQLVSDSSPVIPIFKSGGGGVMNPTFLIMTGFYLFGVSFCRKRRP